MDIFKRGGKEYPISRSLAQIFSAGLFFYIGVAIYTYFSRNLSIFFILWSLFSAIILMLIWHNYELSKQRKTPLSLNLLLGTIAFLPIYFPLVSTIYYPKPVPLSFLEQLESILGGYLILPVLIITIQQTIEGWAIDLFCIAVLLTNESIKRRKRMAKELQ
ncbi:MAG: hypothetical protein AB1757_17875 [Acidobacteriota bacterium]